MPEATGTVTITRRERGAIIRYAEGPDRFIDLDAELAMGKVLLSIYAPKPQAWDARVPWAAGRREVVLDRVAREVVRRESRCSRFRVHDGGIEIFS